nr:MAG TPA: hypothetical protein [Caudoviricetes sp.]
MIHKKEHRISTQKSGEKTDISEILCYSYI